MPIAVMIVDSKAATRARLAGFVRKNLDFQLVAQAASSGEAVEKMSRTQTLDLVLMGPGLPAPGVQAVMGRARQKRHMRVCLMTEEIDLDGMADWGADAVMPLPDDPPYGRLDLAQVGFAEMVQEGGNRDSLTDRLRQLCLP